MSKLLFKMCTIFNKKLKMSTTNKNNTFLKMFLAITAENIEKDTKLDNMHVFEETD